MPASYLQSAKRKLILKIEQKNRAGSPEETKSRKGRAFGRTACHAMFAAWEPAKWALRTLAGSDINNQLAYHYRISFVRFYLEKPHILRFKTEWNQAFISHCDRKYGWDKAAN